MIYQVFHLADKSASVQTPFKESDRDCPQMKIPEIKRKIRLAEDPEM